MTTDPPIVPGSPLRILVGTEDGRPVVCAQGELDLATVPQLEAELSRLLDETETVLDLSEVSFIDSSGIAVLVALSKTARQKGWRLQLRSPSPPVARLIKLTGVEQLLGSPAE
jgi:anti-sigma B factor antagonist